MEPTEELSKRQQAVLAFVVRFWKEKGYSPSVREIASEIGVSSTSLASFYLDQLSALGYLKRDRRVSRSIVVTQEGQRAS